MPGGEMATGKALVVTLGGPISNLVLASGGIIFLCLVLRLDVELMGTAVFGLYFFGLAIIYTITSPALRLFGFSRAFKVVLSLEGLIFLLFLTAHLT